MVDVVVDVISMLKIMHGGGGVPIGVVVGIALPMFSLMCGAYVFVIVVVVLWQVLWR